MPFRNRFDSETVVVQGGTVGLLNTSEADLPDLRETLDRLIRHLDLVKHACEVMGKRVIRTGDVDFGLRVIAIGRMHDISKFNSDEWSGFCVKFDPDVLAVHYSRNPHHPEFYDGDIRQMPKERLWELVADVWARSVELGGDVRAYLFSVLPGFDDRSNKENNRVWCELETALTFLLEEHL